MPCASSRSCGERLLRVAAQLFEHRAERRRVRLEQLAGEPELHRQRDEVLLRAVVEVALDLAARLVGRGDDARTRHAQLVVGDAQIVERGLQRGVEPRVVERERDRTGELGEHPILFVGERRVAGAARADDEPEQLAGVRERRDPQRPAFVRGEQRRQPAPAATRCRTRARVR